MQTSDSSSADRSGLDPAADLASSASDMSAGADPENTSANPAWEKTSSDKENSPGNIVQELAKQPGAVMDPDRWNRILEVHHTTPHSSHPQLMHIAYYTPHAVTGWTICNLKR